MNFDIGIKYSEFFLLSIFVNSISYFIACAFIELIFCNKFILFWEVFVLNSADM